jgi:TolB protein
MTRSRLLASVLFALALGSAIVAATQPTQPGHYGIFSGSTSIGGGFPGNVVFEPYSGVFRLTGGGADMWGAADSFHLAWVKLQGDATIAADVEFPDKTPQPLAKAVLIFRQTLDPDSAYADVAIHADGHITLQWRDKAGAETADAVSPLTGSRRIRIERRGDLFTASALSEDNKMIPFATHTVSMTGPIYVGIGACSHDVRNAITILFRNVSITRPGM